MDIDKMAYGELKSIAAMFGTNSLPVAQNDAHWKIGKIYLIRTVTMAVSGRLVQVTPQELVLEDAAWIADTGRFSDAMQSADFGEVEPFPDGQVIVGRGGLIDAAQIVKAPRSKK